MCKTERDFESEYNLGRLDLCRVSTKVCLVVCLAAAFGILLIETVQVCESMAPRWLCCVCQERKSLRRIAKLQESPTS